MILPIDPGAAPVPGGAAPPQGNDALRAAAQGLEAAFLTELLAHARVGEPPEGFGGGTGEAQFASLLRAEYAREMAAGGGVGLAEQIFRSLAGSAADAGAGRAPSAPGRP